MELFYLYYDEENLAFGILMMNRYKSGLMSMYTEEGKLAFFDESMFENCKLDFEEENIEYQL